MLFYGDSAADKKIIHLSDHINTKREICFQKGCKIEEAFAILIYLEKKFYNPVHRLKAFIAPQVFSVENTHTGDLYEVTETETQLLKSFPCSKCFSTVNSFTIAFNLMPLFWSLEHG